MSVFLVGHGERVCGRLRLVELQHADEVIRRERCVDVVRDGRIDRAVPPGGPTPEVLFDGLLGEPLAREARVRQGVALLSVFLAVPFDAGLRDALVGSRQVKGRQTSLPSVGSDQWDFILPVTRLMRCPTSAQSAYPFFFFPFVCHAADPS